MKEFISIIEKCLLANISIMHKRLNIVTIKKTTEKYVVFHTICLDPYGKVKYTYELTVKYEDFDKLTILANPTQAILELRN